jgi:hypothetical protein
MFKIGTVEEAECPAFKNKVPREIYQETLSIVTMLDEHFGSDRDVDEEDGGFVLIIEKEGDLTDFCKKYDVELDSPLREYMERVQAEQEPYLNVFFLYNEFNFGITLLIPMSLVPQDLLSEFEHETMKR